MISLRRTPRVPKLYRQASVKPGQTWSNLVQLRNFTPGA